MSDEHRYGSGEVTLSIPRECLPPISSTQIAAMDIDPDHPETVELRRRATTLVPCPAGCGTCGCCFGAGGVSVEEAEAWRLQQSAALSEPDDE